MLIQLEYDSDTSYTLADARTCTLAVELFLRGIHSVQLDSTLLQLEDDCNLTVACVLISADRHVKRFKILG